MKKITWLVLALFFVSTTISNIPQVSAKTAENPFTGLIISWQQMPHKNDEGEDWLWIRTREVRTGEWTEWYHVEGDEDVYQHDEKESVVSEKKETLFSTNLSSEFEYRIDSSVVISSIRDVQVEKIISDSEGKPKLVAALNIPKDFNVVSRAEWGANEEITYQTDDSHEAAADGNGTLTDTNERSAIEEEDPEIKRVVEQDGSGRTYGWPLQYRKDTKFIVIHHTASVTNLENPKTAIQNIEYYHAVKRRWGDIGYNYIIDTRGEIYEGRKGGESVVGGHARPVNKVSIGIAVLGNYDEGEVPVPVIRSLLSLISAKAQKYDINVNGQTKYNDKLFNNVQGHYENSPTACPGKYLKKIIDELKTLVVYNENSVEGGTGAYNFEDFQRRNLIVAPPNAGQEFTIRLKNNGTAAWNKDTFLENLSYTEDGILPKIIAHVEGEKVEPGNIGVFKGKVAPSLTAGLQVLNAKLVINGSVRPEKTLPVAVVVEHADISYQLISIEAPPTAMKPNQQARAKVVLKNTGNVAWKRDGKNKIQIGTSRTLDRKSVFFKNKNRIGKLVQREVKPGETGTFIFTLTAPRLSGTFKEYFQPVLSSGTWLKDAGMNFTVQVDAIEKPLRVALSYKGTQPKIKSADGMKLYEGNKRIHEFEPNQTATVRAIGSNYEVKMREQNFILKSPPRFKPDKNGILEITNYKNRPAWNKTLNDNTFRGTLEVQKIDGKIKVINELSVEDYLKGIGEVSNGDPAEKIKTIIILARSYAQYYRDIGKKFPGKPYDLDDDPDHTQKYVGYGLEQRAPNIVKAVEETSGKVVLYNEKPVLVAYFNQSDGRTRSAKEVWGWTDRPYLQSVPDTFCGTKKLKGHGVGLSGCGATELAKQGKVAEEIIKYYYTGVTVGY